MTTSIADVFAIQKANAPHVAQTTYEERRGKLIRLRDSIIRHQYEFAKAVYKDFQKGETEAILTEIFPVISEIEFAIKNLKCWMKPKCVRTPLLMFGTWSKIHYQPKGVCLILGPWNYPFSLVMNPIGAAVAAGNCCLVKPSEIAPATSAIIRRIVEDVFPPDEVAVFEGGVSVSTELLALPTDHIFFTGSTRVGKIVMEAAAKNLTSVTLELGGKSPCILDSSADLAKSAYSIAWGKFINGGQTCIAPDYVFVPRDLKESFVAELRESIQGLYGDNEEAQRTTTDYCRIIDDRNFNRITKLLDDSVQAGAVIEYGGQREASTRYLSPTIVSLPHKNLPLMSEEIFGPVLPVLTYDSLDEVFTHIRSGGKPLSLYIFSQDSEQRDHILAQTSSGGVTVNNTLLHLVNSNLPFGGVNASGIGSYHGFFGFKAFSHERGVTYQGPWNFQRSFHPPFKKSINKMLQFVLKYLA